MLGSDFDQVVFVLFLDFFEGVQAGLLLRQLVFLLKNGGFEAVLDSFTLLEVQK